MKWRIFISVAPPPEVISAVADTAERCRSALGTLSARWVSPHSMHMTLRFLGDVGEGLIVPLGEALRGACAGIPSFVLEEGRLGCFPSPKRARVLWAGFRGEGEALTRLVRAVFSASECFATQDEVRDFVPHLTLARIAATGRFDPAALARAIDTIALPPITWPVRTVNLMRSVLRPQGAEHVRLNEFSLADGAAAGRGIEKRD